MPLEGGPVQPTCALKPGPPDAAAAAAAGPGRMLVAVLPIALAIAVFGTIFGAMSRPVLGPGLTIAASALIWSGVVQFSVVGLLMAGASPTAVLVTALAVNVRNPLLGAILRPHLRTTPLRRAVLSWFLIDETVGLALASPERVEQTLAVSGVVCYLSWLAGTVVGVGGGALAELQPVAEAVFPALFVGLAALAASTRDLVIRSLAAAALTLAIAYLVPALRGVGPVLAALAVAYPGRKGP